MQLNLIATNLELDVRMCGGTFTIPVYYCTATNLHFYYHCGIQAHCSVSYYEALLMREV